MLFTCISERGCDPDLTANVGSIAIASTKVVDETGIQLQEPQAVTPYVVS